MRDNFPAIVAILALCLFGATCVFSCQNDMKARDQREECHGKGGVWFHADRKCLDLKTIPLKDQ